MIWDVVCVIVALWVFGAAILFCLALFSTSSCETGRIRFRAAPGIYIVALLYTSLRWPVYCIFRVFKDAYLVHKIRRRR